MKRFWVGSGQTKEVVDEGDLDGVANDVNPKPPSDERGRGKRETYERGRGKKERETCEREKIKTLKSHRVFLSFFGFRF